MSHSCERPLESTAQLNGTCDLTRNALLADAFLVLYPDPGRAHILAAWERIEMAEHKEMYIVSGCSIQHEFSLRALRQRVFLFSRGPKKIAYLAMNCRRFNSESARLERV